MKKIAIIAFLLAVCVAAGRAQESRQDISLSGTGLIEPFIGSSHDVYVHSTPAYGALLSYRFMLTPSSAIEANYGITYQNKINFSGGGGGGLCSQGDVGVPNPRIGCDVLTRTEEISAAYVRTFNYRKFNPFLEAGPGAIIFLPIQNSGTKTLGTRQQTEIGFVYGGGIAYEISPSFDIRAEYRGLVSKVPTFNEAPLDFTTGKWWNIYEPTIGIAYHF
jgi:opacity protein-like surface antigen